MLEKLETNRLALDVKNLADLKLKAKTDPEQAIHGAAQQFEAIFLNMMLKSMRTAAGEGSLLDNQETRMFTGLMDQQLAEKLSTTQGIGLAALMVKQLSQTMAFNKGENKTQAGELVINGGKSELPSNGFSLPGKNVSEVSPSITQLLKDKAQGQFTMDSVQRGPGPKVVKQRGAKHSHEFVDKLRSHAEEASKTTGVPAQFILGHAALETGWGKHEIRALDGSQSFNLFGIKAGKNWKGRVVSALTTEHVNGVATKVVQKFRAYASYTEAFQDYAKLLKNNPRYAAALEQGQDAIGFAKQLQRAGYATDPAYANKLASVLNHAALRSTMTA